MNYIYDIESYPNCFTLCAVSEDGSETVSFECSHRKNEVALLFEFLDQLKKKKQRMVGFNNVGYDYPVLHDLLSVRDKALTVGGKAVAARAYKKTLSIINSVSDDDRFKHIIKSSDEYVKQVDLYKIHHFDNKARATSLKALQFNMRRATIEDLPFPVGSILTDEQIDVLLDYNKHDIFSTLDFYRLSKGVIDFRDALTVKYGRDFTNHNDTKIGKDYFIMRLEEELPGTCYVVKNGKRQMNQTKRNTIKIKDCLFNYYDFERPEFVAVLDWFSRQSITETKGVFSEIAEHELGDVAKYADMYVKQQKFKTTPTPEEVEDFKQRLPLGWVEEVELKTVVKGEKQRSYWMNWREAANLNVVVDHFQFDFGTGGIHGSLGNVIVKADDECVIMDADVASMYPNLAITNRVYPEHLTEKFCDIYEDVYNQRKSYAKGTTENAMLKLALNGVYGDSNNKFSPFYDPKYTMTITINGQLSICLLVEKLMKIKGLSLIQVNTDGLTAKFPRKYLRWYQTICRQWEEQVGLQLEFAEYSAMYIRDVNNYIAVYTNGKVKRKGVYQYENLEFHKDHSGLVIKKAAEANMLKDVDIKEFVRNHSDIYDFMMRVKVPRNSKLVLVKDDGTEIPQQNTCRYYASKDGGKLVKIMPPIKPDSPPRRIEIESGWNVKTCNNMADFDNDIEHDYYVVQARELSVQ